MGRNRNRSRQALCPAISTISLVCFGALLLLAVLSVLSGRLLDMPIVDSRSHAEFHGSAPVFLFDGEDSPVRVVSFFSLAVVSVRRQFYPFML